MKGNWLQLPIAALRIEIYEDLLTVHNFLNDFDKKMNRKEFATLDKKFYVRWNQKEDNM